jgi:RNA polymerase sigma-70 factor (ECF subfamily)
MSAMEDQSAFADLIRRVRAGDEDAATELVRQLEPFVLRVVRMKLRMHGNRDRLRHDVGSMDVCQSVMASLFKGLKEDRFSLVSPEKLKSLLRTMIQFNVASKARKQSVTRRTLLEPDEQQEWIDQTAHPEESVIDNDRMNAYIDRLSEDELGLLTRRLDGQPWEQIASELDEKPDALRKRLKRGMDRVESELNDRE